MNDALSIATVTKDKRNLKRRFLACIIMFCLVFVGVMAVSTTEVDAASLSVSKVKFSRSSFDVTQGKSTSIKVSLSLNKNVPGANYAEVTLSDGKKTRVQKGFATVKGRTVTLPFVVAPAGWQGADGSTVSKTAQLTNGKWRVTKLVLKKAKKERKWSSGFYSSTGWHPGHWYTKVTIPKNALTSCKVTKTTKFNFFEGKATKIAASVSAKSVKVTQNLTFTAKLTAGGKAIKNQKMTFRFYNQSGKVDKSNKALFSVSVKTNSSGVAKYTMPANQSTKFTDGGQVSFIAFYGGQAKKYKLSNSKTIASSVRKESLKITSVDTSKWNNHSGTRTYTAKVVDEAGNPMANVPLQFSLVVYEPCYTVASSSDTKTVQTDSKGVATVSLNNIWFKDGHAILKAGFTNYSSIYYQGSNSYTSPQLKLLVGTKYYTIDVSNRKLLNGNRTSYYFKENEPWGTGVDKKHVANMIELVFMNAIRVDGKPVNFKENAKGNVANYTGSFTGAATTFSGTLRYVEGQLQGSNTVINQTAVEGLLSSASKMTITLTPSSAGFGFNYSEGEYNYLPAAGQNSISFDYTWK